MDDKIKFEVATKNTVSFYDYDGKNVKFLMWRPRFDVITSDQAMRSMSAEVATAKSDLIWAIRYSRRNKQDLKLIAQQRENERRSRRTARLKLRSKNHA